MPTASPAAPGSWVTPANPLTASIFTSASAFMADLQPADTVYSYAQPASGDAPLVAPPGGNPAVCGCPRITAAPASRTDCTGWLAYVLQSWAPAHYAQAKAFRDAHFAADACPWPRAYIWYQYLRYGSPEAYFEVSTSLEGVAPGDFVVWALGDWASETGVPPTPPQGDTGHVAVVMAPAANLPPLPQVQAAGQAPGTQAVGVAVADSSTLQHLSLGEYADRRLTANPQCASRDEDGGGGWGGSPSRQTGAARRSSSASTSPRRGDTSTRPGPTRTATWRSWWRARARWPPPGEPRAPGDAGRAGARR
ncbi:MAG TPA: hypothetical protein VHG91_01695, partial [Longimicrobium sp.]|nr:hypothetical protein [Longimicrobium sp.]